VVADRQGHEFETRVRSAAAAMEVDRDKPAKIAPSGYSRPGRGQRQARHVGCACQTIVVWRTRRHVIRKTVIRLNGLVNN
jgi:hypothetical protein